jgi:SPP1 family predicted phage head-tail adaptor
MRSRLRSGDLRVPVYLAQPIITKDDAGGEVINWSPGWKIFAMIEPLSGREWLAASLTKDSVDVRITIRYMPTLVPSARWRITDPASGTFYNITSVQVHQSKALVELLAKTAIGNSDGR